MTEVVSGSPAVGCEDCINSQALQVALELSMLNINSGLTAADNPYMMSDLDVTSKSLNVTQCVSVPSSEHVAEIVGKQGLFSNLFILRHFTMPFLSCCL